MSRESRWTYMLLAGCVLLIALSAYMLITQAKNLASARDRLQATNRELAQKQAQLLIVSDALMANQDQATMVSGALRNVGQNCSRPESLAPTVRALCAANEWAAGSHGQFVAAYAGATVQRASAASADDWHKVRATYESLRARLPRNDHGGMQWAARVEEGIAYADYRLGNLDEAQKQAEEAARLDNRSAFVGLTRLKIACGKQLPKGDVQRMYAAQRQALEDSIAKPAPGMDEKYARLELGYFGQDPEVRAACDYAGLPSEGD